MRLTPLPLLLASLLLTACQTTPEAQTAAPEAVPSHDLLNATLWQQQSAEARAVQVQTWRSAGRWLDAALADPQWDALAPADRIAPAAGLPPAIIVDADETIVDNSPFEVRIIREGKAGFDEAVWEAWVAERRATAIPGALEFLSEATRRGVTVYYVTNRSIESAEASKANLRALGFPMADDAQFLPLGANTPGCESQGSDKGCRRQWVAQRHRVLMQFGDQLGDFFSIRDNTPQGRSEELRPFDAWLGQRWFVLPNPMYGSWESAAYGNDRTLTPDQIRRRKIDGLRD
jgi:acid phosphatase